jgi:hypothetical protein
VVNSPSTRTYTLPAFIPSTECAPFELQVDGSMMRTPGNYSSRGLVTIIQDRFATLVRIRCVATEEVQKLFHLARERHGLAEVI